MKITHYSNSFISVRSQGEHFVCDPWMGKANTGGWQSFPEYPVDQLTRHLSDARWIYVSHLHDDHFHPQTLKALGLLDREFVIKRFQAPVMRERLKKLGVMRIHELDPFAINRFGPFEVAIFPQMTSNSCGLDDDVNFDLDTSIVFRADGTVFFNQVDNPLSTADLSQVQGWIFKHLGKVDIACLMSGAASEYPHLFLGIDQEGAKRHIVDQSLKKLITWLELLEPSFYFPAGGTYIIPGWLSAFGHNVAQPAFPEIEEVIQNSVLRVHPLSLEGGYSAHLESGSLQSISKPEVVPIEADMQLAIKKHRHDSYLYEALDVPAPQEFLELLDAAQLKWANKVLSADLRITQSIQFKFYTKLAVVSGNEPDQTYLVGQYELYSQQQTGGKLLIHIDQRALYGCITRRFIWNGILGSLCLYERTPNKHYPTDFFSINFFVV